jgi:hypothetical protein
MSARRSPRYRAPLAFSLLGCVACGALCQNMRGEFVSYRGAWFCAEAGCGEAQMKRSDRAHREGEITINHGKPNPNVALVFNAGKPVKTMTATVEACGKSVDVPADAVKAPGSHGIAGESESWVVVVDPGSYGELDKACKNWKVTTHSTWDKGTKWDVTGGFQVP